MGAIKITPADKYFSVCVRERAENRCERCGGSPERGGLHCSHFHGRGKWSVRFAPENATALCMGCHLYFGSHPVEHTEWQREKLGDYWFEALREKANDLTAGRVMKREQKHIAAHYRKEHQLMLALRASGAVGRLDFTGH